MAETHSPLSRQTRFLKNSDSAGENNDVGSFIVFKVACWNLWMGSFLSSLHSSVKHLFILSKFSSLQRRHCDGVTFMTLCYNQILSLICLVLLYCCAVNSSVWKLFWKLVVTSVLIFPLCVIFFLLYQILIFFLVWVRLSNLDWRGTFITTN